MSDRDLLHVLGLDGSTGNPLGPLPVSEAEGQVLRALRRPRPPRYGIASGDLASAGWGVVFPEDVDIEVREALEPLLARRRHQAGDRFRELTYLSGEGAADFRNRLRSGLGRVDPEQVPWYLLLVGDPAIMPYGFELDLGVPHAVGRLAFEDVSDFRAYARRVVEVEERQDSRKPRTAVFAPTHPDDPSTAASVEHLARPLANLLEHRGSSGTALLGEAATRAALLDLIDRDLDLLVVAGHAVAFASDKSCQRERQGALVCADWPGPIRGSGGIPPEHTVAAEDLPAGALDGGVAILFGCHTAGTPLCDPYDSDRLEDARELTPSPFVAALPQRLLGRHGGALAVLGHVGRTFEASFLWRDVPQAGAFEDAIRALLEGRRLGEAVEGFGQRYADMAVTWSRPQTDSSAADIDLLDLWQAFHEARSWALLGDPAVRLPAASAV